MQKNTLFLIRIIAICLVVIVFFSAFLYKKNEKIQPDSDRDSSTVVLPTQERIERIFVLDDIDYALMSGDLIPELVYEEKEHEALLASMNEVDVLSVYGQGGRSDDTYRQFALLEEVYETHKQRELLPYLVSTALRIHDYAEALSYLRLLEEDDVLGNSIDPTTLFIVLFNGLDLTTQDLVRIKDDITLYERAGRITQADVDLWSALIAYTKGDLDNYAYFMSQLSGTVYDAWYRQHQANLTISQSYVDVPSYYIDGLTALQVFSHGYYQVARVAANRIQAQDPNYILAHQIAGYASMMMDDRVHVVREMERLRDKDEDNEQLYTFLGGIAHVQLGQYPEAILLLRQVHENAFLLDAKRYLLLAYEHIGEYDAMGVLFEDILSIDTLLPHDFYTIFDLFFYTPLRDGEEPYLYIHYFDLASRYIDACYQRLGDDFAYICLRGKSGLLLVNGEYTKAYLYLQRLVRWYPKDFLYEALGDLAVEQELYDEAKQRYTYSIATTDDHSIKQGLMQKIRSTVLSSP